MFIKSRRTFPQSFDFLNNLARQSFLIDKSNFIKEIINTKEQGILITRPPGWGKTLNLSMLKYFFRIELDREKKPIRESKHRVLFEGGELEIIGNSKSENTIEIKKLNIAKDEQWEEKYSIHVGKYPVIYMDWEMRKRSFEEFEDEIQEILINVFKGFGEVEEYLKNKEDDESKENYKKFKSIIDNYDTKIDIQESLSLLVKCLYEVHQQKVVVLIDDYDSTHTLILLEELESKNFAERKEIKREREKVVDLVSSIVKCVQRNSDKIEKIVMMGRMNILPQLDDSALHYVKEFGVLDEGFNSCFGYQEQEIRTLINEIVCSSADSEKEELINNMNSWYKGYVMPSSSEKELLCPFLVENYLRVCYSKNKVAKYRPFSNTYIVDSILQKAISADETIMEKLVQLNQNTPTTLAINENFNLGNEYFWGIYEVHWSRLLLNFGFLTGKVERNEFYALVTNQEKADSLKIVIERWEKNNNSTYVNITNRIKLKKAMEKYFQDNRRRFGEENKSLFVNLFAGRYLLSEEEKTHKVCVKFKSGLDIIDTLFEPIEKKSVSIIIHEYKFFRDSNKDSSDLLNILWSVYEKNLLKKPLLKAAKLPWIKNIIIRPIVIYAPDTSEDITFEIEDIIHSIEEARKISYFFARKEVAEILNFNNAERESCHKALLKKFQIEGDIIELLGEMSTILEKETPKTKSVMCTSSSSSDVCSLSSSFVLEESFSENFEEDELEHI